MQSLSTDVVVIGGGLSGLTSAFCMLDKDPQLKLIVLEAKGRLGGRTLTKQLQTADGSIDFWDVGGEWIGMPQPHLHYLLKKFQIDTYHLQSTDSECQQDQPGFFTKIDLHVFVWRLKRLRKKFHHLGDNLWSSAAAWHCESVIFKDYYEENLWTHEAKETVLAVCKFMFGLHPSEMSLLYFLMHVDSAGGLESLLVPHHFSGKEQRAKGGIQQLCNHLAQSIGMKNIKKEQPVTHIVQADGRVTVVTSEGLQIQCWRVVIAVPPQHLLSIKFTPSLPSDKVNILQSIPLAHIVKFVFTYDEKFWIQEASSSGKHGFQMVLEDSKDGPVGIVYDGTSSRGNPALVGFLSSSKGPARSSDPREQKEVILQLLESSLGSAVRAFIDSCVLDWSQEEYNGGCFLKSFLPAFMRYFTQSLREPFDRVHFGGTETGTVWCGLMNGAIQAGCRTAAEVLFRLRPDLVENMSCSGDIVPETVQETQSISKYMYPLGILGVGVCVLGVIWLTSVSKTDEPPVMPLCLVTDWK